MFTNASRITQIPPQNKIHDLAVTSMLASTEDLTDLPATGRAPKNDGFTTPPNYELRADQVKSQQKAQVARFKEMILNITDKQTTAYNAPAQKEGATAEEIEKAQALIAGGGENSVKAVATRITDIAKAIAGKDSEKISALKQAVTDAFESTKKDNGGKLSKISSDTLDEILKQFAAWENEGKPPVDKTEEEKKAAEIVKKSGSGVNRPSLIDTQD